jgi:hypothetical protein
MNIFKPLAIAALSIAMLAPAKAAPPIQSAPEYKACHTGNIAACKRWRVRACRDGNPAACDYDEAQKQSDPMEWCAQRYPDSASQYRFCLNGSPDR